MKQRKEDLFRALWNQATAHFQARAYTAAQELYKVHSSLWLEAVMTDSRSEARHAMMSVISHNELDACLRLVEVYVFPI